MSNEVRGLTITGKGRAHIGNIINYCSTPEDDLNNSCLANLRCTNLRDDKRRIEQTKGGLLNGSYRWILGNPDFQRWQNDEECRLFWIKDGPGKGETMLLSGIINEREKGFANRLSYFFCEGTASRINNATAVLRGLIYLLVNEQE